MLARPKKTIITYMLGQLDELRQRLRRVKFGQKDGPVGSAPPASGVRYEEAGVHRSRFLLGG
jgi:hypothetical protein